MAQQNTLIHEEHKMRRVVRDTQVTDTGLESRYECPACQQSAWRAVSTTQTYTCNGLAVTQALPMAPPMPEADARPSPEEITDLLREILRSSDHNPRLRLRIIAMVRRLKGE